MGKGKLTTAPWDKDISIFPKAYFSETFWCFQMQGVCLRKTNISSHVDTRFPSLLFNISKHIVESCQHFPERQIVTFNFITKQQHFKNQTTKTSIRQTSTNEVTSHFIVVKIKINSLVLP